MYGESNQINSTSLPIIACDLDDVLCSRPAKYENEGLKKYYHCSPIIDNIKLLNEFYDSGYYFIVVYTARGMNQLRGDREAVEIALRPLTKEQLSRWGVKYHRLDMGKIHYNYIIDDKAINSRKNWRNGIASIDNWTPGFCG